MLYAFPPEHTSRLPHRVAAMDFLLLLALVAGSRLLARTLLERPQAGLVAHGKEVLIVGAGNAGQLLVREIQRNRALAYTPIGFVDDDPKKRKLKILGVRVLGTTDELARILHENRPDEVLIAMPSAPGELRRKIVDVTRAEGIPVEDAARAARADRGRRQPRDADPAGAGRGRARPRAGRGRPRAHLRRTSATAPCSSPGAGGSIGSELCRQLARLGVARLVLVDQSESALYEIERELVDERAFTAAIPVLADCGDVAEDAARLRALPAEGASSTPPRTSTCRCWRRTRSRR